jgi:type II secretory pathway component GspD/PulD (secretin)
VEKVPLLGDMPGIGPAFRTVQERKEQQEVVILITAHLADQNRPAATEVSMRLEQQYLSPLDAITVPTQGAASCAPRK